MTSSYYAKRTALLILTQSLNDIKLNINSLIEQSIKYTSESLYICINPIENDENKLANNIDTVLTKPTSITNKYLLKTIINKFYIKSSYLNPNINVYCLLNNSNSTKRKFNYELILTDLVSNGELHGKLRLFCENYIPSTIGSCENDKLPMVGLKCVPDSIESDNDNDVKPPENDLIYGGRTYKYGIVAGTFDRLHAGHKILLSESAMLIEKKLLIGITDTKMLTKKCLTELVQPLDERIACVTHFLNSISPNLELFFAPLVDPYGPSISEPEYECLIVSQETLTGGNMVNTKRLENRFKPLDIHVINVVDESNSGDHEEKKISSTNHRKRLLGTLLKQPYIPYNSNKPYLIGLTGGLASGKSSIRKRLEKLGAATIDCDLLGHKTYEKGNAAFNKLVNLFGDQILDENGNINRRTLGSLVFGKPDELKKLTDIVWPEIRNLVLKEIEEFSKQGKRIIVIEAAVLMEANWNDLVNEIWVCFIPEDEAIKRTVDRDNKNYEKVKSILDSQLSNIYRVSRANVCLSTLWEPEYTQKQVEKAWNLLLKRTINSQN